jgi:MtaA/CmuA family methyltransferase
MAYPHKAGMMSRERALAVLNGEEADLTPVFPLLMGFAARQAGFTYREFASNGSCMAESQITLARKFQIDAITACSDAFRISADLGAEIVYCDDTPPYIKKPVISSREDLDNLSRFDVSDSKTRCADRAKAVREMVKAAGGTHLVLGWVDFPFAEACSCCGVQDFMYMLNDEAELAHDVLDFLTGIVIDFALYQLEQGAPMIGCGDAAASLVSPAMFKEFVLPYEKRVVEAIHQKGGLVKTHICGNTSASMNLIVKNSSDLFNVDHMVDLGGAISVYCGA